MGWLGWLGLGAVAACVVCVWCGCGGVVGILRCADDVWRALLSEVLAFARAVLGSGDARRGAARAG